MKIQWFILLLFCGCLAHASDAGVSIESDVMLRAIDVDGRSVVSAVVEVTVTNRGTDSIAFPTAGYIPSVRFEDGVCRVWLDWNDNGSSAEVQMAVRSVVPEGSISVGAHVELPISGKLPPIVVGIRISPEFSIRHNTIRGEFVAPPWTLKAKTKEPNQALQTTPMTRSVYEKTIEFGRSQRGV